MNEEENIMNDLIVRFLKKLNINNALRYEGLHFVKTAYNKENDRFVGVISCPKFLSYRNAVDLIEGIKNSPFKCDIHFEYESKYTLMEVLDFLKQDFLSQGYKEEEFPKATILNGSIIISFMSQFHHDAYKENIERMENLLSSLDINVDIKVELDYLEGEIEKREEKISKSKVNLVQEEEKIDDDNEGEEKSKYKVVKTSQINDNSGFVEVKGAMCSVSVRSTKTGKRFITLVLGDEEGGIDVIGFENEIINNALMDKLGEKDAKADLKVQGYVKRSKYNNDLQINASSIEIIKDLFLGDDIEDTETEKRVELHLHTKMSEMDGVASIEQYCAQAERWGMKAIAVTDHAVVQAFPEAQKAAANHHLKMIYGVEAYLVDSTLEYVFNPQDIVLKDATYVVFDFETTGLSARYDRIIEFGAVKYKNGRKIDEIDIFIDPEIPLPKVIQEKTHITDSMVRGQLKIKKALEIMKNFISDSILVAHNASFDYGFLNEAFKNNSQPPMTNPVIDTLALSWYLFPDAKSHSLGGISRQYKIKYDEDAAHRANYDADVLYQVWEAMLTKLIENNSLLTHRDLTKLKDERIVKNARPHHAIILAKNQQGLKDLFKLVSYSHIECFSSVPRVPRDVLDSYRENFIVGSACFNGEVFDAAMTRSKEVLKKKMEYYDYIEVQPLDNYSFLVNDGQISTFDKVEMILKDLISCAYEINKKVVATSDCHYCRPYQKVLRDIYIFAKTKGGSRPRHPLNPYGRDKKEYENPSQHFRSTNEMLNEFSFLDEKTRREIVITNSNYIASLVEDVYPLKDKLYPPFIENVDQRLIERVYTKAKKVFGDPLPEAIASRLEAELNGIVKYGYSVQFFIASEIVRKTNSDGFLVGSRGSVGSSFVATMADITEVNPLPPHYLCPKCHRLEFVDPTIYKSGSDLETKNCPECGSKMINDGQNLPFATFLGFNAEKVPDIDLNFSNQYQARAHELTKVLLGKDSVFRAGTIETVAEKTAFGYVRGYFERMKINPDDIPNARKTQLAYFAQGVKTTSGQHPGGIIVIPQSMEVYDFTPIQYPANDVDAAWKTTHFDFHAIHDNVLKLDLLGHVDPTALKMLWDLTNIDPKTVPLNDEETISIYSSRDALKCSSNYLNETTGALGIPEFGTSLTRAMLEEIRPKCFSDLVRISGLSHGTDVWAGNAQELLRNKICTSDEIIACRDDVMITLQQYGVENSIAFKTMEAVRKGKKVPKEYLPILKEHNVPEYFINSADKCKYLFPKAHAVAYVTMAVRISWYKVHRPLEYYAVYFSVRSKQYDISSMIKGKEAVIKKIEEINKLKEQRIQTPKDDEILKTSLIVLELYERGYKIEPIDLYKSDYKNFTIDYENKSLIPPFTVIDGLGEGPAETIIKARNERKFTSKEDFCKRTKVNSQIVTKLTLLGVLDVLKSSDQLTIFDF